MTLADQRIRITLARRLNTVELALLVTTSFNVRMSAGGDTGASC